MAEKSPELLLQLFPYRSLAMASILTPLNGGHRIAFPERCLHTSALHVVKLMLNNCSSIPTFRNRSPVLWNQCPGSNDREIMRKS